jgi:hypothetical protein
MEDKMVSTRLTAHVNLNKSFDQVSNLEKEHAEMIHEQEIELREIEMKEDLLREFIASQEVERAREQDDIRERGLVGAHVRSQDR